MADEKPETQDLTFDASDTGRTFQHAFIVGVGHVEWVDGKWIDKDGNTYWIDTEGLRYGR